MKKIFLLTTVLCLACPTFATQYTLRSTSFYPTVRPSIRQTDTEILRSFMTGASVVSGRMSIYNNPSIRTLNPALAYLDPYIVSIEGKNYILVKDSKNEKWSVENILGYDDSKNNLFGALKKLESDGDTTKITFDELKKAGIRFVLLNSDGSAELDNKNLDYNLDNVFYIDMKNLRTALGNKNQDGTFGYFYVIVNENGKKRAVPGRVTFEEKEELQKYIK